LRVASERVSPVFPYTTLFRSEGTGRGLVGRRLLAGSAAGELATERRWVQGTTAGREATLEGGLLDFNRLRGRRRGHFQGGGGDRDRKSTRLNSSHLGISYAVF